MRRSNSQTSATPRMAARARKRELRLLPQRKLALFTGALHRRSSQALSTGTSLSTTCPECTRTRAHSPPHALTRSAATAQLYPQDCCKIVARAPHGGDDTGKRLPRPGESEGFAAWTSRPWVHRHVTPGGPSTMFAADPHISTNPHISCDSSLVGGLRGQPGSGSGAPRCSENVCPCCL